jgi:integrase
MTTRRKLLDTQDRTTWHKSAKGCWSMSFGHRGCRVRVTQRESGGEFFRVTWLPGQGRRLQASLNTTSRTEAKQRAEGFLRALAKEEWLGSARLTLEDLWNRYRQEAPGYRTNTEKTQYSKRQYAELLLLGFGAKRLVKDLTLHDVECYKEKRRTGKGWADGRTTGCVGPTTVRQDLQLLRVMIRWALTVKNTDGNWLLAENPLRGLKLPREENPSRPVSTYDRYLATRDAMQKLAANAPQKRGKRKWIRFELALFLAEATGRRIGSIRGLCWRDIDFSTPSIGWNPDFDKRGRDDGADPQRDGGDAETVSRQVGSV